MVSHRYGVGFALGLLVTLCWTGCSGNGKQPPGAGKLRVTASILPLAYFAERVGGPRVEVSVLIAQGQSEHTFDPSAKQLAELGRARIFLKAGMPFERVLATKVKSSFPDLQEVDLQAGLELLKDSQASDPAGAEAHGGGKHAAGEEEGHPEEGHEHGEFDPHTWLSPLLAQRQCERICEAFCEADPGQAREYRANLRVLQGEFQQLHQELLQKLGPWKGARFLVFHPAFAYFARAYGLEQVAIEFEGKSPGSKRMTQVVALARREGLRAVFVQPQFPDTLARTVADQLGAAVVVLDPLAHEYPANLRRMADLLMTHLTPARPAS
jgi:zinc transport system substrate-binding protein